MRELYTLEKIVKYSNKRFDTFIFKKKKKKKKPFILTI